VVTDRDLRLFSYLFENRVMSLSQIHHMVFNERSVQIASRRLVNLRQSGFLERRHISDRSSQVQSVFLNAPKAIQAIDKSYKCAIDSGICKTASVEHDVILVNLRSRLEGLSTVTDYITENMLQACHKFSELDAIRPFVLNNTDAVIEITRQKMKLLVGLEFENSEKARERYIRKLVNYYSDNRTPVILYICENTRIRDAVAQAEAEMIGPRPPRCAYALTSDVLATSGECTFVDLKGAKIRLC
jgi:hypothetical protein